MMPEFYFPISKFNISHEELTNQWDPKNDYNLVVLSEGGCTRCYEKVPVITQFGITRFGLDCGYCLPCLQPLLEAGRGVRVDCSFSQRGDRHYVDISFDALMNLVQGAQDKSSEFIIKLKGIMDLPSIKQAFEEVEKIKEKIYQCKVCLGLQGLSEEFVETANTFRKNGDQVAISVCCGTLLDAGDQIGCSMFTCVGCVEKVVTKICVFCSDGAIENHEDHPHSLQECSKQKNLLQEKKLSYPPLRTCKGH